MKKSGKYLILEAKINKLEKMIRKLIKASKDITLNKKGQEGPKDDQKVLELAITSIMNFNHDLQYAIDKNKRLLDSVQAGGYPKVELLALERIFDDAAQKFYAIEELIDEETVGSIDDGTLG